MRVVLEQTPVVFHNICFQSYLFVFTYPCGIPQYMFHSFMDVIKVDLEQTLCGIPVTCLHLHTNGRPKSRPRTNPCGIPVTCLHLHTNGRPKSRPKTNPCGSLLFFFTYRFHSGLRRNQAYNSTCRYSAG